MRMKTISEDLNGTDNTTDAGSPIGQYWWLLLIRGIVAILLGFALIFTPSQAKSVLVQYFGMYWLATGATTIFWGLRGARATKIWLLAGSIAVIGGTILVFNEWISSSTIRELTINIFAGFAILTGLLHIAGGYRLRQRVGRGLAWGDIFLGLLQISMGITLFNVGNAIPRLSLLSAVIWAFLGGISMLLEASRQRRSYQESQRDF
jgi:uncharacterized membrane protein HdeD (DUF308 family)